MIVVGLAWVRLAGELPQAMWGVRSRRFDLEPHVNILCGPNGSGKSTLLKALLPVKSGGFSNAAIEEATHLGNIRVTKRVRGKGFIRRFDFEMQNPRMVRDMGMMELADFKSYGLGVSLRRKSHGEAQKLLFDNLLDVKATRGSVLLLDEPEQALDLDGILRLRDILRRSQSQFIVATHASALILDPKFNAVEMVAGYRQRVLETTLATLEGA